MVDENVKSAGAPGPSPGRVATPGQRQFIITSRRGQQALGAGVRPMSTGALRGVLGQTAGVEIVRVLRPRRTLSALSVTPDEATETYVVRIDAERAELFRQTTPPALIVEEDAALAYGTPAGLEDPAPTRLASWNFTGSVETHQLRFRVVGEEGRPLAGVGVSLCGEGFPQEGRTDKRGELTLPLMGLPGKGARALFVSAPSSYWDQYLLEPELSDTEVNVVRLRAIGETIAGFPEQFRYGWGQIEMGLDRVPETFTGKGVRIAVVDSGADVSHGLLRHIRYGLDLTNNAHPQTWTQDVIGHGSHCAGIIAARDESGKMLRGFAPEAEVHVLKVFPGGRFSTLIEALDYCVAHDVDLVNLSLGSSRPSQAVEQKLEELALRGTACIVAAGNGGGPVQYPASSPYSLAVGAIGRLNEYPDTAWDATTVRPGLVTPDGVFSPSFSCAGPEVAVCAPGVAIVSTVPGGFEALSGTSIAAPHVTGLAALLLAHHPAFQGPWRSRNAQRVAGLFAMIRSMCAPVAFGSLRTGAGLPRLHGQESWLRPGLPPAGRPATNGGNGQAAASGRGPVATIPPPPEFAPAWAPVLTPEAAVVIGGTVVDPRPFYVPAPLAPQGWTIQSLLDSMRSQYGLI